VKVGPADVFIYPEMRFVICAVYLCNSQKENVPRPVYSRVFCVHAKSVCSSARSVIVRVLLSKRVCDLMVNQIQYLVNVN
jgi:hypothetical protein